ncbi:MAG TPA: hypothetical protein VFE32_06075 [Puia sp.]|jgi:hypothetical protein|nr:hypothetical protein [Puia sp.]
MVDFAFLRQRGIELLQQLCGESWTDYNLHDPGVTILEALCYALTDLSYRTEFPMGDLLTDKDGKIRLHEQAFHTRDEILSSNPVSVADCRKFILDQEDRLHNVWLKPFTSAFSYGTMHGLYEIKVQVKKDCSDKLGLKDGKAGGKADEQWVADLGRKVRAYHIAARNLGEDIIREVEVLRPIPIWINAEVAITGEQPELILAHIYRDLEMTINPPTRYYTEQELLEKGYRMDEIHAGPKLSKGYIPDDGLQPQTTHVDPAELMKAIAQVPGVWYVRSLTLCDSGDHKPYPIPEDGYPYFLDGLEGSKIQLLRGKYDVKIQQSVFKDIWGRVKEAAKRRIEPVVDPNTASGARYGEYRDVAEYQSVQHLFPAVYGIGNDGPGANPSELRMAQVHQLKGYLLSFEQVLVDYLAQLGHIGEYFSVANKGQTYYTQPLSDVPGIGDLINKKAYEEALSTVTETEEDYFTRRNAVLDHLLARFNERPSDYPVRLYGQLYGEDKRGVLEWKSGLLRNIIQLSRDRVRGFNYLGKEDRGGFEQRMRALLYIRDREGDGKRDGDGNRDGGRARLTDAVASAMQMRQEEVVGTGDSSNEDNAVETENQNWVCVVDGDTMRQRMSGGASRPPPEAAATFGHRGMGFFRHGLNIANYTVGPDIYGSGWLILFKEPGDDNWQVIGRHADERAAVEGLQGLIEVMREMSKRSEGFYAVENVLLRPAVLSKSFGFRFRSTEKEVVMQHAEWMSFTGRNEVLKQIMEAAKKGPEDEDRMAGGAAAGEGAAADSEDEEAISRWGKRALGGKCRILLTRHKEFGFLSDPADLEPWIFAEAAPDFAHIRQQLLLFKSHDLDRYPRFEMLVKGLGDDSVREEFYNFSMTVLLPAWPARFQNLNFRTFVMDVFRQQTPAHIRLYFQWLNITRMKEFEEIYPHWIEAMKDQDNPGPRSYWSDRLVHFIRRH